MMKTGAELSRSDRIFTAAHRSTLLARLVLCFTSPLSQIFSFYMWTVQLQLGTRRKEPACASRASAEQWAHERDLAATVTPGENPVIVGSIWRLPRPLQQG